MRGTICMTLTIHQYRRKNKLACKCDIYILAPSERQTNEPKSTISISDPYRTNDPPSQNERTLNLINVTAVNNGRIKCNVKVDIYVPGIYNGCSSFLVRTQPQDNQFADHVIACLLRMCSGGRDPCWRPTVLLANIRAVSKRIPDSASARLYNQKRMIDVDKCQEGSDT